MITFSIPLPPITKKNSMQILVNRATGKPFIAPSKQYKQYERDAMRFIPRQNCIVTPVCIKATFYMPTKRKCDLTNLLEALDDILVKAGLIWDDNYTVVASHDGSRVYVDKENPRTEVAIYDLN